MGDGAVNVRHGLVQIFERAVVGGCIGDECSGEEREEDDLQREFALQSWRVVVNIGLGAFVDRD